MAYAMWALSLRPNIAVTLQAELDEFMGPGEVPGLQSLARLPYLNAFIKEST